MKSVRYFYENMSGKENPYADKTPHFNPNRYVIKNDPTQDPLNIKERFREYEGLMSEEEEMVSKDLMERYQKNMEELDSLLSSEYHQFSNKVHKCLLNRCYNDIYKSRNEVRPCITECRSGIKTMDAFIGSKIDVIKDGFNECLEKSQQFQKNIMHETFMCYDYFLNSMDDLKKITKKEFSYYTE